MFESKSLSHKEQMAVFGRLLRLELKKSMSNRWFVMACLFGIGCAVATAADRIPWALDTLESWPRSYMNSSETASMLSSYSKNMLTDYASQAKWIFFYIAPLFITLSYSWSLATDRKEGYAQLFIAKVGRFQYYCSKYLATFNCAGLTVAIPLGFSFVLTSCFLPAYEPSTYDALYLTVDKMCILGDLFYAQPLLYMFLRIGLDYIFAGLWAVAVLTVSLVVRNRVALLAVPYMALLLVKVVGERLYIMLGVHGPSITLFDQLKACPDTFYNWNWVTALEMVALFAFGVILSSVLLKRDFL